MHRARWMARVVYAIKIFLFQSQFKMAKLEKIGIQRFVHFTISFYVRNWFAAPYAAKAQRNGLEYLQNLQTTVTRICPQLQQKRSADICGT